MVKLISLDLGLPALPEHGEALAHRMHFPRILQCAERRNPCGGSGAHGEDTQSMTVQKLERGVVDAQLLPEAPDAEVTLTHVGFV
jgi:hypothetical protein